MQKAVTLYMAYGQQIFDRTLNKECWVSETDSTAKLCEMGKRIIIIIIIIYNIIRDAHFTYVYCAILRQVDKRHERDSV